MERVEYVSDEVVKLLNANNAAMCKFEVRNRQTVDMDMYPGWDGIAFDQVKREAIAALFSAFERDGDFRSFRPEPKWRAFQSPQEACVLLGKTIRCKRGWSGYDCTVTEVGLLGVLLDHEGARLTASWQELLKDYLLDNTPVGIRIN